MTSDQAESLAMRLAEELADRWRQGDRLPTEYYLDRNPELRQHPQAVAELILEELAQRRDSGRPAASEEMFERFPEWRTQLAVMLRVQGLLEERSVPNFPDVGESLGEFRLLAELGRGSHGRVFLATQGSLADRPVVLKATPTDGGEHLNLARLQHTHIVPLYSVYDDAPRGVRALCMPYFGGATLADILEDLSQIPADKRTGKDILAALDRRQADLPLRMPPMGSIRLVLERSTYINAVCFIAFTLSEALNYAHDRSLLHLDIKPTNILLAADATPMLLDFHLARQPLSPGQPPPPWFGGTAGYMSPEQVAAFEAVEREEPIPMAVDRRSDVHSLGVLLYVCLGGSLPLPSDPIRSLRRLNSQVSVGLGDILGKCLASDAEARYATCAALTSDLARHMGNLRLIGVRNRSWRERWTKFRRRRPQALAFLGMLLTVLAAGGAVSFATFHHLRQQAQQARQALADGRRQLLAGQPGEALAAFRRGQGLVAAAPWQAELAGELTQAAQEAKDAQEAARHSRAVVELHSLADQLRFLYGSKISPSDRTRDVAGAARQLLQRIPYILNHLREHPDSDGVRRDLLDVAILYSDLHVRLAADKAAAAREAVATLDEAERLLGNSPVLDLERQRHGVRSATTRSPRTAWEHVAVGLSLMRSDRLDDAARGFGQAVALDPAGLWSNFYAGICAFRQGRLDDAASNFSVCVGAAADLPIPYYNRAQVRAALGQRALARQDYDRALALDPTFAEAALNRGVLNIQEKNFVDGLADLARAEAFGAEPSLVRFNRAVVFAERKELAAAVAELEAVLARDPSHAEARQLLEMVRKGSR